MYLAKTSADLQKAQERFYQLLITEITAGTGGSPSKAFKNAAAKYDDAHRSWASTVHMSGNVKLPFTEGTHIRAFLLSPPVGDPGAYLERFRAEARASQK